MDPVRIPFLEPLLPEGIKRGKAIGTFFSPDSEWKLICVATIASRLQASLRAGIITTTRFPSEICTDIARFGVDTSKALDTGLLQIADWYTCLTGRVPAQIPSDMAPSLRVEELGLISARSWHVGKGKAPESDPSFIEFAIVDNMSRLFNYNEPSVCVKYINTGIARTKQDTRVFMYGFATRVLDKRIYADLQSMFDGIIDVRTVEVRGATHTIMRMRSGLDIQHVKGWHAIISKPNETSLTPLSELGEEVYRAASLSGHSRPQVK